MADFFLLIHLFLLQLLNIVSTILSRNRELMFQTQLDLDHLVAEAVSMFVKVSTHYT